MVIDKKAIRSDIPGSDRYGDDMGSRDDHKLIVGKGISLSGEIGLCKHLVVEGYLEVSLKDSERMDIRPSGHVKGYIETETAEIHGYFEGDLVVRGLLVVRSTACVAGNIKYGALQVENGAAIIGNISVMQAEVLDTHEMPTIEPSAEEELDKNVTILFDENTNDRGEVLRNRDGFQAVIGD